jgi:excisionase family DNA binding protein
MKTQEQGQVADGGLWDARDVAAFLKVSRSWVYHQAEAGLLPHLRVGSLLRFDPQEIRRYARGEIAPAKVLPLPGQGARRQTPG